MNILFVCTGNTCRSPLAEVIFNFKCDLSGVKANSAGISIVPNSLCSGNSSFLALNKLGLNIKDRTAVQLTEDLLKSSDLVLTMTSYMRDVILIKFPQYRNNVFSLLQFIGIEGDVNDPFGGSIEVYENTYFQLEKVIELLIRKLKEDRGIK